MRQRSSTCRVAIRLQTLIAAMGLSAGTIRADWPLIRGDAAATGAVEKDLGEPLDILWTYETESSGIEATASIVDGVIYVGDMDGTFHAVNLRDGSRIWAKKFEETGFVAGSGVVAGKIFCVDFNGMVRCLDAENGEVIWEKATDTSLYAAPNVHGSLALIATESGELFAFDAETGDEKWKFSIDQPLRCFPTVVGGRVLVAGCDGRLHAVSVDTGKPEESIDIGGPADGMPAVLDNRVYFCTAGGVFHCMNVKPLASVWKYGHKGQGEEIHAAAVTTDAVVLGTHDKRVVALDPVSGDEKWAFPTRVRVESSPVIAGRHALFGTLRGRFHSLEVSTGDEAWHADVGGRFTASPAIADGKLIIGNEDDGTLYCVGRK